MEIKTPDEIKTLLFNRLSKINDAFLQLNDYKIIDLYDNYLKEIFYFKYYFDFSSAIEEINRNILMCKYKDDSYVKKISQVDKECKAMFINKKDEEMIVGEIEIDDTVLDVKDFYSSVINIIPDSFYKKLNLEKKIKEYDVFASYYGTSESTRNRIAHSLTLINVKYDDGTLFKFMLTFYTLYIFYNNLHKEM